MEKRRDLSQELLALMKIGLSVGYIGEISGIPRVRVSMIARHTAEATEQEAFALWAAIDTIHSTERAITMDACEME